MKKYIGFAKVIWQQTLEYRAESLVWFVNEIVGVVPMIFLWLYMQGSGRLSPDQASKLIVYSILSLLISRFTTSDFEMWFANEIKDGKLSTRLLKPYSIQGLLLTHEAVWRLSGMIYLIPLLFVIYATLGSTINFADVLLKFSLSIPLMVIIFISHYQVSFLISSTAFWIEQSSALSHLKWMLAGIFGGAWFPLYFLPNAFVNIAKFTPFYYWYYFPIQLITGVLKTPEIIQSFLAIIVWILLLVGINKYVWKKGIRYYGASGN